MKNKPKPLRSTLHFFMKITLLQVLITCGSIVFGYALDTSGQGVLNQKISLRAKNADLKSTLLEIEKKIDVKFTYRPRLIKDHGKITIDAIEATLAEVLEQILEESLGYEVIGKQIVLKDVTPVDDTNETDGMAAASVMAITIGGQVLDDTKSPIPGVNILVKGSNVGTVTDADGRYKIEVENGNALLVFSFIGYTTQEVQVGSQTTIDVTLLQDVQSLQ